MTSSSEHFADAVVTRVRALGHPLCVGLDPHLAQLPASFRQGTMSVGDPRTVDAVASFLEVVIDRLAGRVAVIKPQAALFEQLGPAGMGLLQRLVRRAQAHGLLVLLDAKRGDIGSSAEGYARAYLDRPGPFAVDALTVHAYMGMDTLAPYVERCRAGRGIFVLVKTSNSGSGDIQDLTVPGNIPVYAHLARRLAAHGAGLLGTTTGFSALGAVVGATYPEQARQLRAEMPLGLFLVPGYGAQGGSARDAVSGFVSGPNGLEGGLVNSSRAILFPKVHGDSAKVWEDGFEQALREATEALGEAVAAVRSLR